MKRIVNRAELQIIILDKSNDRAKKWNFAGKISGAVEGIDDPKFTGLADLTALLGKYRVPRILFPDPVKLIFLGRQIILSDHVPVAFFVIDLDFFSKPVPQDRSRATRQIFYECFHTRSF